MKTVTDIASFLKRNGTKLTLSYDEKSNTFLAWTPGDECASRYLDDALDNLQEAFRRRANAMTPVRETKTDLESPFTHTTISSSSQAFAATIKKIYGATATTPVTHYPTCPQCGAIPDYGNGYDSTSNSWQMHCKCGCDWLQPMIVGIRVKFGPTNVYEFRTDNDLHIVSP